MMLNRIVEEIKSAGSFLILPHVSADGDALGSSLALGLTLERMGKKVRIILEEEVPVVYGFLPGKHLLEVYNGKAEPSDFVIALDTGDLGRLGQREELFRDARITVNIDHHGTNSEFAFYNFVLPGASAVGEIVYEVIRLLDMDIDSNTAMCLYAAIASDTGGFRFSNTTALTHRITAELVSKGIDVSEISQSIFDSTSLGKVRLMGAAISSLELFERGRVAIVSVTDEDMKATGAREEDCDGIVNIGRNIRGVEVAAMLRQRGNGETKVNLRSNKYVDVSSIAGLYRGGGHRRAAGYTTDKSLEEAKDMLLKDIMEVL